MMSTKFVKALSLFLLISTVLISCNNSDDKPEETGGGTIDGTKISSDTTFDTRISDTDTNKAMLLPEPDSIVVGSGGKTISLSPKDENYSYIYSHTDKRITETIGIGALMMTISSSRVTGEDGEIIHVSEQIRSEEAFVEFIYSDTKNVRLETAGSAEDNETESFTRLLFPLTGEYNSILATGTDENYTNRDGGRSRVFGELKQDTELITRVNELSGAGAAS